MANSIQKIIESSKVQLAKKKRRRNIFTALAAVVVFCTTYALIIPAITWEKTLVCALPEHKHTKACYEQLTVPVYGDLLCTQAEHMHTAACYEEVRSLVCTIPESDGHIHSDGCFTEYDALVCGMDETAGHSHGPDCYSYDSVLTCTDASEEHIHSDECYEAVETLICSLPEGGGHTHTAACYEHVKELTCTLPEAEPHHHSDACYHVENTLICNVEEHTHSDDCYEILGEETRLELTCGMEEHTHTEACFDAPPKEEEGYYCGRIAHTHSSLCYFDDGSLRCTIPEHTHTLECEADPSADVETQEYWESTFKNVTLTGDWAKDVLSIARTQLGYRESESNFIVYNDMKYGYTRYGAWYGYPYSDWCAMFCSFCLDYAQVNNFPLRHVCADWVEELTQRELYHKAGTYFPKCGDLIFFDFDEVVPNVPRKADHVGFVSAYTLDDSGNVVGFVTIEGNRIDDVSENKIDLTDSHILGFGVLPENPALRAAEAAPADETAALPEGEVSSAEADVPAAADEVAYTCGLSEHTHSEACYLDGELTCTLPEHTHTAECLPTPAEELEVPTEGEVLTPAEGAPVDPAEESAPEYTCGLSEHTHSEACYLDGELTCALPEHTHTEACIPAPAEAAPAAEEAAEAPAYRCGMEEHEHNEMCYSNTGKLTCEKPEHKHTEECLPLTVDNIDPADVFTEIRSAPASDGAVAVIYGKLPVGAVAQIKAVSFTEEELIAYFGEAQAAAMKNFVAYDITIMLDGEEWQPDETVSVTVEHPAIAVAEGENFAAAHIDGETEAVMEVTAAVAANGDVAFEADGFSIYCFFTFTVDFHFGEVSFSIAGRTEIRLSELFAELNVLRSAAEVTGVTFSDESLVTVTQLPEEQDWLLTSLLPFNTDEMLTIAFADGEIYQIAVTDGQNVEVPPVITVAGEWDAAAGKITSLVLQVESFDKDHTYAPQYSDDGSVWTKGSGLKPGKTTTEVVFDVSSWLSGATVDREFRVSSTPDNKNYVYSSSYTLEDILDSVRPGFKAFLNESYTGCFGYSVPSDLNELYDAFSFYINLPSAVLTAAEDGDGRTQLMVSTDVPDAVCHWQVKENGVWVDLPGSGSGNSICANNFDVLLDRGRDVRCLVYQPADPLEEGSEPTLATVSNVLFVNPNRTAYDEAIAALNTAWGFTGTVFEINGDFFRNHFYYGNVAGDYRLPGVKDASTYADYLASIYLSEGEAAARAVWDRYLYDIYDPDATSLQNISYSPYPTVTYGDDRLEWPKDNSKSFHNANAGSPVLRELEYNHLEGGVDYSNFITGLDKKVTADDAGDANDERKYNVEIIADAQAQLRAPVAMILQIQTSWQMFDMQHANALIGEGKTEKGAVANNSALGNLYDIKNALLRLIDYMEVNYPGNNLVLGITETQHAGSSSMFATSGGDKKGGGGGTYVSNDYATLREGLLGWDTFGNCEHVHYDTNTLSSAVSSLELTLAGWKDEDNVLIPYENIEKVAVIIGGPTENDSSTNGYACTLPWSTFSSSKIDAVYGIRTNEGTSRGSGVISWIDYSANNSGAPYNGSGSNFTQKYVATNEDAIFNSLVDIANREMNKKTLPIQMKGVWVEEVKVTDTVTDEFLLDPEKPIQAVIVDDAGNETVVSTFDTTDGAENPRWEITENADGTTTVTYTFDHVENTEDAVLRFGIVAKEDFIGSNNVYSNVGFPALNYRHTKADGSEYFYDVNCTDTPQVNVPIRFDVKNGGEKTVDLGVTVDLGSDVDLNSKIIVKEVQDLVDNYDQINGTLTYTWVYPDGSELSTGSSSKVTNGKITSFPSRLYDYPVEEGGTQELYLKVTFTPEVIDPANPNFAQDDVTNVAVEAHDDRGKVTIICNAPEGGNGSADVIVRKRWIDRPADAASIKFIVTATVDSGSVKYVTGSTGSWALAQEAAQASEFTLNDANNWELRLDDLPREDSNGNRLTYAVEEVESTVPDLYEAVYTSSSVQEEKFKKVVQLSFNCDEIKADDTSKYHYVLIKYKYKKPKTDKNGNLVYDKNGNLQYDDANGEIPEIPITFGEDEYGKDTIKTIYLASNAIPDVKDFTIDKVSLYGSRELNKKGDAYEYTDKKDLADKNKVAYRSAEVPDGYINVPVRIITNQPKTVNLTVKKFVDRGDTEEIFAFTAKLEEGSVFPPPEEDDGYALDADGNAYFYLSHGDSVTLKFPAGKDISIQETEHSGYFTYVRCDISTTATPAYQSLSTGDTVDLEDVQDDREIEFVNSAGSVLPATGGIGVYPFYISGSLLIAGALIYGFFQRRKETERRKKK